MLSYDLVIEFFKNISINKYIIELINDKQSSYRLIYTLSLIELEILKIYIETYLKIEFIQLLKSLPGTPIYFNKKHEDSFYFYINY